MVAAARIVLLACVVWTMLIPGQAAYAQTIATKSASMNVGARIAARPDDFLFSLTSDLATSTVGADQQVAYTLSYGSLLDYATPMTLEVEWSLGSDTGSPLSVYDLMSYVAGSATPDYWGTSVPVVDLTRRRIVWRITRFPANTIEKSVRFSLRTPSRFVTDRDLNYTVRARLVTDELELPWVSLEQTYSPTEFIRREVRGMEILVADIRKITDSSFGLFLVTSVPTRTVISYGTDPYNLDKSISDSNLSDQKLIIINNLSPNTTYYFKILIENENLIQKRTRETFSVTTAATSLLTRIDSERALVASRGVILGSGQGWGIGTTLVVPTDTRIDLFLPFRGQMPESVSVSIGQRNVLGISTDPQEPQSGKALFLLTAPGTYSGAIRTPAEPGTYDLILEVGDQGTRTIDTLLTLSAVPSVKVVTEWMAPIEKALVYVERYDESSRSFVSFPGSTYAGANPGYTGADGVLDLILPDGEYRMSVNAIGYETYQTRFTLSSRNRTGYPVITLRRAPFSFVTWVAYYWEIVEDSLRYLDRSVDELAASGRFRDGSIIVALLILTASSTLLNLRRIRMTMRGLWVRLEKTLRRHILKEDTATLYIGFVEEAWRGMPVYHADIMLINKRTKAIRARDITNALGEFQLPLVPGTVYELAVRKRGFIPFRMTLPADALLDDPEPVVLMRVPVHAEASVYSFVRMLAGTLIHGFSDLLVLGLVVLHLYLVLHGGGLRMAPLAVLALLNLGLWVRFHWVSWRNPGIAV